MKWKTEQNARQLLSNALFDVNRDNDEDDDVEERSISSESSGEGNGGGISLNLPDSLSGPKSAASIDETAGDWQTTDEIEQIVKELPDSANVLEALTLNDFSRKENSLNGLGLIVLSCRCVVMIYSLFQFSNTTSLT